MQLSVTLLLIIANVIVSLIGFSNPAFLSKTIFSPYDISRKNEWYRFITSSFLHADYMHLFFNMFTLYFFGRAIESYFSMYGLGGTLSYLLLYFLGMIVADIPSYIKNKNNYAYRSLGASGAVSAVIFACILFQPWGKIYVYFIPLPFALYAVLYIWYCMYMSKRGGDYINHDAHLWGSVFGLVFTIILISLFNPALFPPILNELMHPHFG